MNKRGFEHIEIIIGFTLFIIFLMFGLYFFNPLNNTRVLDSSLSYAITEIQDNTTSALETYGISFNPSVDDEKQISFSLTPLSNDWTGIRVEDNREKLLRAKYSNADAKVYVDIDESPFVLVKFGRFQSPGQDPSGTISPLTENQLRRASSDSKEIVSEQLFNKLVERYNADYTGLKRDFNLPGRIDFAFSLTFSESKVLKPKYTLPDAAQVFSDSKRIEVIKTDGTIAFADLLVITW
jgi:hypothetical protein